MFVCSEGCPASDHQNASEWSFSRSLQRVPVSARSCVSKLSFARGALTALLEILLDLQAYGDNGTYAASTGGQRWVNR